MYRINNQITDQNYSFTKEKEHFVFENENLKFRSYANG